jgi:hypothetical protein
MPYFQIFNLNNNKFKNIKKLILIVSIKISNLGNKNGLKWEKKPKNSHKKLSLSLKL